MVAAKGALENCTALILRGQCFAGTSLATVLHEKDRIMQTSRKNFLYLTLPLYLLLGGCATAPDKKLPTTSVDNTAAAAATVRFTTDAQWLHAGYDQGTTVYQIFIVSQDTQILRCNTLLQAHSETGAVLNDQQTSTVFPGQRTQVGNWTGLDQDGETHYTVDCKAL